MKQALTVIIAALGFLLSAGLGSILTTPPAFAQMSAQVMPTAKGPAIKPRPMRPRPSMGGPGFKGPAFDKRPAFSRPRPFPTRPSVGMTRPIFNNGQGVRPTPVRPRPVRPLRPYPTRPNKYPSIPNFVDTPQLIDDITPTRPPSWRPPVHRPPYYRPPSSIWGDYYYYGGIGWYNRFPIGGSTLTIVHGLPPGCSRRVKRAGRTLYKCNGVYYDPRVIRGERVYEVVSKEGRAATQNGTLRLTKPYMRGSNVRALQNALKRRGYNVGTPDGVFGRGTARALMAFQRDVGLTPDGVAGRSTLRALR